LRSFSTRGKETILGLRFLRFSGFLRAAVKAAASSERFTEAAIVGRAMVANKNGASSLTVRCTQAKMPRET